MTTDELDDALEQLPQIDRSEGERLCERIGSALFGSEGPAPVRVGRYRVGRRVGVGAMGEVFEAHDDVLERKVALKIVRRQRASPSSTARLVQEAKSLARLDHPNVVRVYEVGFADERAFIAMQFVEGSTLREWLTSVPRSVAAILAVLRSAGRGLLAAHEAGLVHRDFKPDNVLVGNDGHVRVADFGLVRLFDATASESRPPPDASIPAEARELMEHGLTHEGTAMGTPAYMPPEQLDGRDVDARSDQFAFCVTCWEALFGVRPFEGKTAIEIRQAIETTRPMPAPREGRVPGRVVRALRRGLAARPDQRFETLEDLLRRLAPRSVGTPVLLGVTLAVATTAGFWAMTADGTAPCDDLPAVDDQAFVEKLAQLRRAYESTDLPYAHKTGQDVAERLTAYVGSWDRARAVVCDGSTADASLLAIQAACLDHRRLAMEAAVERVSSPDPSVVERAIDAVADLPSISPCLEETDDPRFSNPSSRELMIATLDARASAAVGRSAEAQEIATRVIDDASAKGDVWAQVEARRTRADASLDLGQHDRAVEDLLAATDLATLNSLDDKSIELWGDLAWIGASVLRDRARAEEWLARAQAWAERTGVSPPPKELELTTARVLELTDLAAARRAFDDFLADDLDPDSALARKANKAKAAAAMQAGAFEEAAADYQGLLDLAVERYGSSHPTTAGAEYNLGFALDRLGSPAAGEHYGRALEIWTTLYPDGSADVVATHIALGNWTLKSGDVAAAGRHADATVELGDELFAADDSPMGEVWTLVGAVAHARGRYDEAARAHGKARDVYEGKLGADHIYTAVAHSNRGEALLHLRHTDESRRAFEHALRAMTVAVGVESPYLAYPRKGLGLVALVEGRSADARALLSAARDAIGGIDPIERLEIEAALAATERDAKRTDMPERFLARARKIGPPAVRRLEALQRLL